MKRLIIGMVIAILLAVTLSPAITPTFGQSSTPEPPAPGDSSDAIPAPLDTDDNSRIYLPFMTSVAQGGGGGSWTPGPGWPTVGANPARTSWTADTTTGNMRIMWYRPIEAYISQNVQLIASDGVILVSSSRGLYALTPSNGAVVWRYDTSLPLGNSPTVANGIVYVGGYDRKIHALDVRNGAHLWEWAGAAAGFDTNPLVVDGRVFAGNRDGYLYAIGAHGANRQGQLLWRFKSGGPIHLSAAYKDGVIFFAANDNYAYALDAAGGAQIWKSAKLPGDGYHSYWPVVFQDKVVFTASNSYRFSTDPGTFSVLDRDGVPYSTFNWMQTQDLFPNDPDRAAVGPTLPATSWSHGFPVLDVGRINQYYEAKPWRRTTIVLNIRNGSEYTFDTDNDSKPEYAPVAYWGTSSGNRYPPMVSPDNLLYVNNITQNLRDARGSIMAWSIGTKYMSQIPIMGALAEPQALSGGGNMVYRTVCCDRMLNATQIDNPNGRSYDLWSYDLHLKAPGYDSMWIGSPDGGYRLQGNYKGNTNSVNGIYHNHGDQNPAIPYGGMLFNHRSNTIIAMGTGSPMGKLPTLTIQPGNSTTQAVTATDLSARLEGEIQKIVDAGHLRPGYYNNGTFIYPELATYFDNPGDTLLTLSLAYPYLSAGLQTQVRSYLQREFTTYFDPTMYTSIGWAEGAAREAMPLPPEVQASLGKFPKGRGVTGASWTYPPQNFYAMWKYATVFPDQAGRAYDLAKGKLEVPVPSRATAENFRLKPYELNAYIAGYVGFLRLQEAAGRTGSDAALRTQVTNELNRLYQLRVSTFSKDSPFTMTSYYHKRSLNIARNFIYMAPELGAYIRQADLARWQTAIQEYEYVAPYWFVARYEAMVNESALSNLYNYHAMFRAKAYIQSLPQSELVRYLDTPAFERGDLYYIQNLITTIEAR